MTDLVFVDTNILVYMRDAAHASKQAQATQCMKDLWSHRSGRISMQVLGEFYTTVTRNLPRRIDPDAAWRHVVDLMSWNPQPTDRALLESAREIERRYRTSWYDATIIAAAQRQRCKILLSEDFQDGMNFDQVTVRNPFASGVPEKAADYSETVVPNPRHRRRGRPARVA